MATDRLVRSRPWVPPAASLTRHQTVGSFTGLAPKRCSSSCVAVCVRFLRTQQRVNDRCQVFALVSGCFLCRLVWGWLGVGVFISLVELDDQLFLSWLFDFCRVSGPSWVQSLPAGCVPCFLGCVVVGVWTSTESLILAQDERWRRA